MGPPSEADNAPLFRKLKAAFKRIGLETTEKTLWLFYAAQSPQTPAWAKKTVYAALAYLVLPIDLIPDVLPVIGLADDSALLLAAVTTIAVYIDEGVRSKASAKMKDWFGESER